MSHNPFPLGMGPRTKAAAAAAVVAAAVAATVPAAAHAQTHRSHEVLAAGIGMHSHPSVRVRALQRALARHGFSVGRTGIDGRFGPLTRRAVRRAQRAFHLKVDGIAGRKTLRALRRPAASHRSAPHRPQVSAKPVTAPPPMPATAPAAPARVRPHSERSSGVSSTILLIVILLAAATAPALGYLHRRRRSRVPAVAGDELPGNSNSAGAAASEPAPAVQAAAEDPPAQVPVPTATSSDGLRRGALVIGYVTEPLTTEREVQRAPERGIEGACNRAGWQLVDIVRDRHNGRILERPSLSEALNRLAAGEANALVVNDARLLSRAPDFASFVEWFRNSEAALIALDLGLDTSTPEGRRVAGALITLNGWASEWLADGTHRSATNGRPKNRERGRAPLHQRADVLQRIGEMDESAMSAQQIADQLNEERVPTLFGTDRWWPSSVQAALRYWRAGSATRRQRVAAKGE